MIVLICGSRHWTDRAMIEAQIFMLPQGSRIVHGDCVGADKIAGCLGEYLLYDVQPYPTTEQNWRLVNQKMLEREDPDEVWVFHDGLEISKGTKDMVNRALEWGYTVKLFSHENPQGKILPTRLTLW